MFRKVLSSSFGMILLLLMGEASMAADTNQILFDFARTDAANEWQTVNDGVMGGISDGRIRITAEKTMVFYGTLSLENNGGFASVRSTPQNLDLNMSDILVVRARGDGREYSLNLYTQRRLTAFSYRAMFTTKENEWLEIRIPMNRFVATSFGQIVDDQPLDPKEVNGLGILLGDKNAGPFKLEIEWIKVIKNE